MWPSRAGVRIDLLARGICCLRPGLPGSAKISASSVSSTGPRTFQDLLLHNGGNPEIYSEFRLDGLAISRSALKFSNPIEDTELKDPVQISRDPDDLSLNDNVEARLMQPDGRTFG